MVKFIAYEANFSIVKEVYVIYCFKGYIISFHLSLSSKHASNVSQLLTLLHILIYCHAVHRFILHFGCKALISEDTHKHALCRNAGYLVAIMQMLTHS